MLGQGRNDITRIHLTKVYSVAVVSWTTLYNMQKIMLYTQKNRKGIQGGESGAFSYERNRV